MTRFTIPWPCAYQSGRIKPSPFPETCTLQSRVLPGELWSRCLLAPCPIPPHKFPASGAPVGWNLLFSWEASQNPPISRAFLLLLNGVVQKSDVPQRLKGLLALGPPPLNTGPAPSPVLDCGPDCNPNQLLLWWALGPGQRADARKNVTKQQGSHRVLATSSCNSPLSLLLVLEPWGRLEQPI